MCTAVDDELLGSAETPNPVNETAVLAECKAKGECQYCAGCGWEVDVDVKGKW
jgi:hypothetical protein